MEEHNPRAEQSWKSSQNLEPDHPMLENIMILAVLIAFITYILPGGY